MDFQEKKLEQTYNEGNLNDNHTNITTTTKCHDGVNQTDLINLLPFGFFGERYPWMNQAAVSKCSNTCQVTDNLTLADIIVYNYNEVPPLSPSPFSKICKLSLEPRGWDAEGMLNFDYLASFSRFSHVVVSFGFFMNNFGPSLPETLKDWSWCKEKYKGDSLICLLRILPEEWINRDYQFNYLQLKLK